MKIYTKKGDAGETSLFSGRRTTKSDPLIAAVGDLDELSAALGLAGLSYPSAFEQLRAAQHELYLISAVLSAEGRDVKSALHQDAVVRLERIIDEVEARLPPLRNFIYPGETEAGSRLHMARAITRRAERAVATLDSPAAPQIALAYLNRLSDLLFVWARSADAASGREASLLSLRSRDDR